MKSAEASDRSCRKPSKQQAQRASLLNHAEKKLTMDELQRTMKRAAEVGLATMVCADNLEQSIAIAKLHPDIIIA